MRIIRLASSIFFLFDFHAKARKKNLQPWMSSEHPKIELENLPPASTFFLALEATNSATDSEPLISMMGADRKMGDLEHYSRQLPSLWPNRGQE